MSENLNDADVFLYPEEIEFFRTVMEQERRCPNDYCRHLTYFHHYRMGCGIPFCSCDID